MADAINRRGLFGGLAAGAAAASLPASTLAAGQARDQLAPFGQEWSGQNWSRGLEGQRRADLDDGRFLNPIMAGDRPDPTILKDGDVYYMTFSSFESVPGLVIWRSTDLVNWTPVTAALKRYIGSVWAPELCRHEGRYYHEYTMAIAVERESATMQIMTLGAEDVVIELLRDLARWLYRQLEQEYWYQLSDAVVDEAILANEYSFTEDGACFP